MLEPILRISKLRAARRQLESAVSLWVEDRDPVSVHTLVAAAHQIIHDINSAKNGPPLLFDSDIFKEGKRAEINQILRGPMNFFKHADKDPNEIIEFNPNVNTFLILFTIWGLNHLGEEPGPRERVFLVWCALHYPDVIRKEFMEDVQKKLSVDAVQDFRDLPKEQFFRELLSAFT